MGRVPRKDVFAVVLTVKSHIQAALHLKTTDHDANDIGPVSRESIGQLHKAIKPTQLLQVSRDKGNNASLRRNSSSLNYTLATLISNSGKPPPIHSIEMNHEILPVFLGKKVALPSRVSPRDDSIFQIEKVHGIGRPPPVEIFRRHFRTGFIG